MPSGGLYVRRAGESVILGFDHYCSWLGAPIGLLNRRHFILFTLYTGAMAAIAAAHLTYELLVALPARLDLHGTMLAVAAQPEILSPWRRRALDILTRSAMDGWSDRERWGACAIAPLVWLLELCAAAFAQGQLR